MEILIYTPHITTRIRYIADYIFHDYLLIPCSFTDSIHEFENCSSVKISYGSQPVGDELFVGQHPLLLETTLVKQNITVFDNDGLPAFFPVDSVSSPFSFDIFAASFYLITRYEEYHPHANDKFGRYSPKNALAVQSSFLDKPLVNIWAQQLLGELKKRYSQEKFPSRKFDYIPTYDIDQPYAHLHRGFVINVGGLLKSLVQNHFKEAKNRLSTLLRIRKDRFDTYSFQFGLQDRYGFKSCYFVLCAMQKGKYERALQVNNSHIIRLMERLRKHGTIGIHPSFASQSDSKAVGNEKSRLSALIKSDIMISRQHYLMLQLPQTYRALLENGIKEDYTMGYASRPGFRASVCTPFKWFDLSQNEVTDLTVYPFAYMDGTLNHYMELSRGDAEILIRDLIDSVKAVNGLFISLWHNSSLCDSGSWSGWRSVYKRSIEYADSLCDLPE